MPRTAVLARAATGQREPELVVRRSREHSGEDLLNPPHELRKARARPEVIREGFDSCIFDCVLTIPEANAVWNYLPRRLSFSNKPIPSMRWLKVPFCVHPVAVSTCEVFDFISSR